MATKLIEEAQVVLTPGSAFGDFGEGFIRISYASSEEKCEQSSKMYIFSPQSVHYVALTISNGFAVLQSVAAASHIKDLTTMNQTIQYGSGNRCIT